MEKIYVIGQMNFGYKISEFQVQGEKISIMK